MNYTLHQLNVFLAIVDHESITKAAHFLNLSQPAVSIQFKNFQDQFSLPLTEVIGKKVFITDFGLEIAKAARNILFEVEEINYKIQQFNGLLSGKIKISIVNTGKYVMPYFISNFFMKNKGLDLYLDTNNKNIVIENLKENQTDFALLTVLPPNLDVEVIELLPNYSFLVCHTDIWNQHDQNLLQIMNNYPFLLREEGSATRFISESFLKKNKFNPIKKIEFTSNEALKQAILAGMGLSILPLVGMKDQISEGSLKIVPVDDLPRITTWKLVWLKNKTLSPAARAFVAYLLEEKSNLKEKYFDWMDTYIS